MRDKSTVKKLSVFIFLFISAASTYAATASYTKAKNSIVGFTAHTTMFDVDGTFKDWQTTVNMDSTNLENSLFEVKVKTKSVDTGISKRDNHLREDDFFNSARFPYAHFKSDAIKKLSKRIIIK